MSTITPSSMLYGNLILLNKLVPGKSTFVQCLKEDMFAQPNRTGFEQVIYYLLHTYDPVKCAAQVTWPLIERSQDRLFRRDIVAFVKDIAKEISYKLPAFSPSFLTTPGGERFAKFMAKLSMVCLKTVLEREGDVLEFPSCCPHLIQSMAEGEVEEFQQEFADLETLIADAEQEARKLSTKLTEQSKELKELQAALIQAVESAPLPENLKKALLSEDPNVYNPVLSEWDTNLQVRCGELKKLHPELLAYCKLVESCHDKVQSLVNSRMNPTVLDGSALAPGSEKPLDLGSVLMNAVLAVQQLAQTLKGCGGFQPPDDVGREIIKACSYLRTLEEDISASCAGFKELLNEVTTNTEHDDQGESLFETPSRFLKLSDGNEMLQDMNSATPPMVFQVDCESSPKLGIYTESPPIGGVVDVFRARKKIEESEGNAGPRTPLGLSRRPLRSNGNTTGFNSRKGLSRRRTPDTSSMSATLAPPRAHVSKVHGPFTSIKKTPSNWTSSLNAFSTSPTPFLKESTLPSTLSTRIDKSNHQQVGKNQEAAAVTVESFNGLSSVSKELQYELREGNDESKGEVLPPKGIQQRRLSIRPGPQSSDEPKSRTQDVLDLVVETIDNDTNWLGGLSFNTDDQKDKSFTLKYGHLGTPSLNLDKGNTKVSAVDDLAKSVKGRRESLLKTVLNSSPGMSPTSPVKGSNRRKSMTHSAAPLILGLSPVKSAISPGSCPWLTEESLFATPRSKSKKTIPTIMVSEPSDHSLCTTEPEIHPSEFDSPDASFNLLSDDISFSEMTKDEDFSPSGRLSWVPGPSPVQEAAVKTNMEPVKVKAQPTNPKRRKSLLAVIDKFYQIVGSKEDRQKRTEVLERVPSDGILAEHPNGNENSSSSDLDLDMEDFDFNLDVC